MLACAPANFGQRLQETICPVLGPWLDGCSEMCALDGNGFREGAAGCTAPALAPNSLAARNSA